MNFIKQVTEGGSRAFRCIRVVLGNPKLVIYPLFLFIPVAGFLALLAHAGYIDMFDVQGIYNLQRLYYTLSYTGRLQLSAVVGLLFFPLLVVVNIAFAQCSQCALKDKGVHLAESLRFGFLRLWAGMPILISLVAFLGFLIWFPEGIGHVILHLIGLVLFSFAFPVLADMEVPSLKSLQTSVRTFVHNIVEFSAGSTIFVLFAMLGSYILLHFGGVLGIGFAYVYGEASLITTIATVALPLFWLLLITAAGMVFAVDLYRHTKA